MKETTRKILGTPKTSFHKRTLTYIEPLLTEMIEEDIEGKKLTLEGCWKHCYEKGRKLATNNCAEVSYDKGRKLATNNCAEVSEDQEREWVREYFGIEGIKGGAKEPLKLPETTTPRLDLDLGSLFD